MIARQQGARYALGVLLLLCPLRLWAHAHLVRSEPASHSRIAAAPATIRLWFSEAPELAFSTVTLLGPDLSRVALGPLQPIGGQPLAIQAAVQGTLRAGRYTVLWRTAGADGHPSRGRFDFVVLPQTDSAVTPPTTGPPVIPAPAHVEMMQRHTQGRPHAMPEEGEVDASAPVYIAIRWLTFITILALVGVVAFRWLVLAPVTAGAVPYGAELDETGSRRAGGLGLIAAALLLAVAVARLFAQSYAMHGGADATDGGMIRAMLVDTVWGAGWLIQVGLAMGAVAGFAIARRGIRAGWGIASVCAVALTVTPALSGHAIAASRMTTAVVLADALHVLGGGGWLGGLLALMVVGLPAALALEQGSAGLAVADLVEAYSPTALAFAALIIITGTFTAWLHIGSVAALWSSGYGRTLLLKLLAVVPMAATGAYNWRRVRPSLGSDVGAGRLRRSASAELAIGALVLTVTAVLVAVQPPR
ncbi:MAG: copper resistance CopC/CopD family protein [Gemmatimonadaceae bacterium]